MKKPATMLLVLVLAAPALAGPKAKAEESPAGRFHQAYVLEVIEGKIKEAAKIYLDLTEEKGVSPRIRNEARFRFAVTAALLGRADEARARLSALAADADVSKDLRARAAKYERSLQGVVLGSELTKKLTDLVFELAKESPWPVSPTAPPAYRDFEVIGKPAIPFLKRLLTHPDAKIRIHAFRILCRMNVPGMGKVWKPGFLKARYGGKLEETYGAWQDFKTYLNDNLSETSALDKTLSAMDESTLRESIATCFRYTPFIHGLPLSLAKRLAPSKGLGRYAALIAYESGPSKEAMQMLLDWLRHGSPKLALASACVITQAVADDASRARDLSSKVFPQLCFELTHAWPRNGTGPGSSSSCVAGLGSDRPSYQWNQFGVSRIAKTMSPAAILRGVSAVVKAWMSATASTGPSGYAQDVLNQLAWPLRGAVASVDPARLKAFARLMARLVSKLPTNGRSVTAEIMRPVLQRLPGDEADSWMRTACEDLGSNVGDLLEALFQVRGPRTPRDAELLVTAMESTNGRVRQRLFSIFRRWLTNEYPVKPPTRLALMGLYPRVIAASVSAKGGNELLPFSLLLKGAEPKKTRAVLLECLKALRAVSRQERAGYLAFGGEQVKGKEQLPPRTYVRDILGPSLHDAYALLDEGGRRSLVADAIGYLQSLAEQDRSDSPVIVKFVDAHLDDAFEADRLDWPAQPLLDMTTTIPLSRWIPLSPLGAWTKFRLSVPEKAGIAAAQHFAGHPEEVNPSVIAFLEIVLKHSPERTAVWSTLLERAHGEVLHMVLMEFRVHSGGPVPSAALEKKLDELLAAKKPDLESLRRLGDILIQRHPTKKLFAVARDLLASGDSDQVLSGIYIAKSLGQPDLLPDLAAKLDSLDSKVRDAAKAAIDSIHALQKLRAQAKKEH